MYLIQLKKLISWERKQILSKGMSNIDLKATIEKNWRFQNFDFLGLKTLSPS